MRPLISRNPALSLSLFVLMTGFSFTLLVTFLLIDNQRRTQEDRFALAAARHLNKIQGHLENYLAILRAGTGFYIAAERMDAEKFRDFTEPLQLREHYPGIQGIGFAGRVLPGELAAVEVLLAADQPNFKMYPAGSREVYYPIFYLEPLDMRNQKAIGFDMFSEAIRQQAMDLARRTGAPAISGKVTLVQEISPQKQAGFLIYLPVYQGGDLPPTVEERLRLHEGFIYAPFRADDLFAGIFGDDPTPGIRLAVYDGSTLDPAQLLHQDLAGERVVRRRVEHLPILNRIWTIHFMQTPEFATEDKPWVVATLLFGLVGSLLLSGMVYFLALSREQARQSALQMKENEERMRASLEAAEAGNRAKDQFLAVLSHELRTPLTPVLLSVGSLKQHRDLSPQIRRLMEMIERNVEIEARLIDDLLDLSRITHGKVELSREPIDLHQPLKRVLESFRQAWEEKGLRLEERLEASRSQVLGDEARLQQVFWNLLKNAIKYTPKGGLLQVQTVNEDDHIVVVLRDTGRGMTPSELQSVFHPFEQGGHQEGGLGLGLSISRALVEAHEGTLIGSSTGPNQGAEFRVMLPLIRPA